MTLVVSEEIRTALAEGRPVVALETTIVSHGMPWPENIETALAVEAIVRDGGAVPASIAVLDGKVRVGLDAGDLERLAKADDVMKLSRADLAWAVVSGRPGATTVAATMIVAAPRRHQGVRDRRHRRRPPRRRTSFDISADLPSSPAPPSRSWRAGAKALLDLPKTLEMLETLGVPVVAYRQRSVPRLLVAPERPAGADPPRRRGRHRRLHPRPRGADAGRRHAGRQPGPSGRRDPGRRDGGPHRRRAMPKASRRTSPARR